MNYLVTGGAGFVGSYVTRRLLEQGHRVVVFDSQPSGTSIDRVLGPEERARAQIVAGDVTDLPHLLRLCQDSAVERIVHLAYLLGPDANANPARALKVNCEGTNNLFEVARLLKIPRLVWASSIAVFGSREDYPFPYEPLPNDAPLHPTTVYGACKALNEMMAQHYYQEYGLDIIGLRFSTVYGLGRLRGRAQATTVELINKPALGEKGIVPFGDDLRDWLYVDDAARAAVLTAEVPATNSRAFIVSGDLRPVREVAAYLCRLVPGAAIELLPGSCEQSFRFDTRTTERELGFRPAWSMEAGVRDMVNTLRRQAGLSPVG